VSNFSMRMRWRPTLCLWGLILFGLLTYASIQGNREMRHGRHGRYFWWGSVRLDSDPLDKHPKLEPCTQRTNGDCAWEPLYIWVEPGLLENALVLSALPAVLLGRAVVFGLARLGVNELTTFMSTMPVLILAWFYGVGWLLDRWQHKRSLRRSSASL
jgi:hypothetical protein